MRALIRRAARLFRRPGRTPLENVQDAQEYIRRTYGGRSAGPYEYDRGGRIL